MVVNIDEDNLKHGVLGLVIALVEIIRDTLRIQALKRMERNSLTPEECDRLGKVFKDLDTAIEGIKEEQGVAETVRSVRDGLDDLVDDVLDKMLNPDTWAQEAKKPRIGREGRVVVPK